MKTPETSPILRLPCKYLRNKEMYYQDSGQDYDEFASGVCWCTKTQEAFGPDGQPAGKTECCSTRPCYIH